MVIVLPRGKNVVLPDNKILAHAKLKAFADNFNLAQSLYFFFNPLPDDKISDWSKLKQIADDMLKCIKNGK